MIDGVERNEKPIVERIESFKIHFMKSKKTRAF